jgi:rhodanese-related sulfurtransferase
VLCAQGYTSSLAAAALLSLSIPASDLAGGFQAWIEAGLPTAPGPTPVEQYVRG